MMPRLLRDIGPAALLVSWMLLHASGARLLTSGCPFKQGPPVVVADGGASVLFPSMTTAAYSQAVQDGATVISCGLLITKDAELICRPGPDLGNNTDIVYNTTKLFSSNRTAIQPYVMNATIDGIPQYGLFSFNFTLSQIRQLQAVQDNWYRTVGFNGFYGVLTAGEVFDWARNHSVGVYLDVVSPSFFLEYGGLNVTNSLAAFLTPARLSGISVVYVACNDLSALRRLRHPLRDLNVPLIFKMEFGLNSTYPRLYEEPSSGLPYTQFTGQGELLHLANVDGLQGVLVPKTLIWPQAEGFFEDMRSLEGSSPSALVARAKRACLEVHVYGFANDSPTIPWDFGYDFVDEYLHYTNSTFLTGSPPVDALLSPNPATAAAAVGCYHSVEAPLPPALLLNSSRPLVIGDDAFWNPAQTNKSLAAAVADGADAIICYVQMSKDGVPFCLPSPDMQYTTSAQIMLDWQVTTEPEVQRDPGIFTFDHSWDEISLNLTALQARNDRPQTGLNPILSLRDFLSLASLGQRPPGLVLDLQIPSFLKSRKGLDVAQAVVAALNASQGLLSDTDTVWIQSLEAAPLQSLALRLRNSSLGAVPGGPKLRLVQRLDNLQPQDPSTNQTYTFYTTEVGLQQIAGYAWGVSTYQELALPVASFNVSSRSYFFSGNATNLTAAAHASGLKVWVYDFFADPLSLLFDYQADFLLKANYFLTVQRIDGLVTEYPRSLLRFLGNECYKQPAKHANFTYPRIVPGHYSDLIAAETLRTTQRPSPTPAPAVPAPSSSHPSHPPPAVPTSAGIPPPPKGATSSRWRDSCRTLASATLLALLVLM